MGDARFTLTFGGLSHAAAFALMDEIEAAVTLDPVAVTINETDEAQALWETVAWFATEAEAQAAQQVIGRDAAVIAPVPVRDWVRESLAGLAPVNAGRFFLYGSHDRSRRRSGGISLEIDAGTAFGTGHHGTTRGCLEAFDALLKRHKPRHVFDLGTGTGVLALAAAKALGRPILASDIDAEAVRVTQNNARHNGAGPLVRAVTAAGLHAPAIHRAGPFDLVFANILAKPLERLATGLARLLAPGGLVILSGLTRDQKRWISACYRARGLVLVQALGFENWCVLVMQRPATARGTRRRKPMASAERGSGYAESV